MPAWTRRILPSWRFIVVLLAGIASAIAAFQLAGIETRDGRSPSQVLVVDERGYFEDGSVEAAVADTVWARPVRILIYVGPETSEPGICDDSVRRCLPTFTSHVEGGGNLVSDAVVLWIEPDRKFVSLDNGNVPFVRSDTWDARWDLSSNLAYLLRTEGITPSHLANAMQIVSDSDSNAAPVSRGTKTMLALVTGVVVMMIVGLGLAALKQWRSARRRGGSVARLSRHDRRDLVAKVRRVYTEAATSLDEVRLIGAAHAKDGVIPTRVAQWETRYADFARSMFAISDDDDLSKLRQAGLLAKLSRQADLVEGGMAQLKADDAVIRGRASDHPAPAMLAEAIDAAEELATVNGDTKLAALIPGWRRQAERQIGTSAQVRDWDDVARQLATSTESALTAYRVAHGADYPDRFVIEDPARIRSLEKLKPGQRRNRPPAVSAQALKDVMERAQSSEANRTLVRLPISPALITLAAVGSIVIGTLVATLTTPRADHIEGGISSRPEITEALLGDSPQSAAHEVPVVADDETVAYPQVTVVDHADLFEDDDLVEGLAKIPFPIPMDIVVASTDEVMNDEEYHTYRLDLAEEFPEYWETYESAEGDAYAFIKESDQPDQSGTIFIWFADGGEQRGVQERRPRGYDLDYLYGEADALDTDGRYEILAWNTIIKFSNHYRHIDISSTGSTIASGSNSVRRGVVAGGIAFPLIIALTSFGAIPFRRRRQNKAWEEEFATTMSALTLGHDALKLEMTYVAAKHASYPAQKRWENWDEAYTQVLRETTSAEERNLSHEILRERLTKARVLRTQAQSLWRIRPILESSPGWSAHWDDEVALIYAVHGKSGDNLAGELIRISNSVSTAAMTPLAGLRALDVLSGQDTNVAALRCLGGQVSVDKAESSGVLTLFSNADEVGNPSRDRTITFSFETGAWSLTKRVAAVFFDSDWMPRIVGTGLVLLFAYSPSLTPEKSLVYDDEIDYLDRAVPGVPRSVTVIDDAGIIDDEKIKAAFETMEWGATSDLIVFTVAGACDWESAEETLQVEDAPGLLYLPKYSERIYLRGDTVPICVSPTTVYFGTEDFVDVTDFGVVWDYEQAVENENPANVTDFLIGFLEDAQPLLVEDLRYMPDLVSRL